jgi:hypothetical protein
MWLKRINTLLVDLCAIEMKTRVETIEGKVSASADREFLREFNLGFREFFDAPTTICYRRRDQSKKLLNVYFFLRQRVLVFETFA